MKNYSRLQNAKFTVFTVSELLKENQQVEVGKNTFHPD